jgi:hypothetical protein
MEEYGSDCSNEYEDELTEEDGDNQSDSSEDEQAYRQQQQ